MKGNTASPRSKRSVPGGATHPRRVDDTDSTLCLRCGGEVRAVADASRNRDRSLLDT